MNIKFNNYLSNDTGSSLIEVMISMLLITSIIAPLLFFVTKLVAPPLSSIFIDSHLLATQYMSVLIIDVDEEKYERIDSLATKQVYSIITTEDSIVKKQVKIVSKTGRTLSKLVYYDKAK